MRLLTMHADGGARGNPGPAAYGVVIRDGLTGETLAELADHLGVATNNVAEYTGLLEGLRWIHEHIGDAQVSVHMDSKLVVEQMSGGWKIKQDHLRQIALQVRDVMPYDRVTYTWVPREQNAHADRLANESLDAVAQGKPGRIVRTFEAGHLDTTSSSSSTGLPRPTGRPGLPGWHDQGEPTVMTWVRHGVTDHTVAKRFSGSGGVDLPLSDLGRAQALAAGHEIAARGGADVVVTSPLLRTRQTAEHISDALGLSRADVVVIDDLRECAFGSWDGLSFAEVMESDPEGMARWLGDPHQAPPGGESFADVHARIERALLLILAEFPGRRVVPVAHVTPVKCAFLHAIEGSLDALFRIELPPASLTTISWFPDGNVNVRGIAETTHLRGIA